MKTDDDPLDALLGSWQVHGEVPAGFQREVWTRISAGEADLAWWERLSMSLLRPFNLGCAAAAAVAVGALLAVVETLPATQSARTTPTCSRSARLPPFIWLRIDP